MIFQFRIISDENKEFAREILVDGKQTFLDFHHVLQENLDYDPAQLASFFLTNQLWEKEKEITLIDMMFDSEDKCLTMDNAMLSDFMKEKGQRILYVFDFFSERFFFIELVNIFDKSDSKAMPVIVFAKGAPPPQIDLGIDNITSDDDASGDASGDDYGYEIGDEDLSEGFDFADGDDFPNE